MLRLRNSGSRCRRWQTRRDRSCGQSGSASRGAPLRDCTRSFSCRVPARLSRTVTSRSGQHGQHGQRQSVCARTSSCDLTLAGAHKSQAAYCSPRPPTGTPRTGPPRRWAAIAAHSPTPRPLSGRTPFCCGSGAQATSRVRWRIAAPQLAQALTSTSSRTRTLGVRALDSLALARTSHDSARAAIRPALSIVFHEKRINRYAHRLH